MIRYTGRITAPHSGEHYAFIGLSTVKHSDGSSHGLNTKQDIFVHQDDCDSMLIKNLEVSFVVMPDSERGGNALRAVDVIEIIMGELVLVGAENAQSTALSDPRQLYVPPTPAQQARMKPIDPEAVNAVLTNQPMPRMPRDRSPIDAIEGSRELIARLFPQFAAMRDESDGDLADEGFDTIIREAVEDHKSLGMTTQAEHMLRQANVYKGLRTVLRNEEDLLTPETIIPIQYLPDLFMAVPVWYFWANDDLKNQVDALNQSADPFVHQKLRTICDMIPNQRWIDTFLMFNRRMRTLADYEGDIIPPKIIARMRKMAPLFDHLVIMTPYHDVAGGDWNNIDWLRSIDPYVVGFLKDIPLMFVVGRFSDSGVFPLHSELLADTISFLRQNIQQLQGFNAVSNPYWYRSEGRRPYEGRSAGSSGRQPATSHCVENLGNHLIHHTEELLAAFYEGNLFDWLRGENSTLSMRT